MKDITKERLVDLFQKLFVDEYKVPSYYLEIDQNCENIESIHEGISDDFVYNFYELVGVDYWAVYRWSLVYKKYKIKLAVNRKKEQVSIVLANLKEEVKDNEVYWNFSQIHEGIKKLKNTFIVNYDVKEEANIFYYKYTNAIVFLDYIGENNFIDLIENGTVRYDNRLGIYRTGEKKGNLHNHGGGFRINAKNLDKLFATKIEI